MQLTLETYRKTDQQQSQEVGVTRLEIDDDLYQRLSDVEVALQESGEQEAFIDIDNEAVELNPPQSTGRLTDCKLRVYLRSDDDTGHFHLVGRPTGDDALVYTTSAMVRTIAF